MKKLVIFFILFPVNLFSQSNYILPIDLNVILSSNFGELRENHFHSGIDIKTAGKTGWPLKSIDDGYVARVRISSDGYGRAIYINHPSGQTSVYGHLEAFSPKIEKIIERQQRLFKKNEFEIYLSPDFLPVDRGEIIGFSGNSGRSGGPHLHFEIRNTQTEHPLNVLQFYPQIKDKIAPIMRKLYVYHFDSEKSRKLPIKKEIYSLSKSGANYMVNAKNIAVSSYFSFGIDAIDRMTGSPNTFGLYKLQLFFDNINRFEIKFDSTSFLTTRGINALLDYQKFIYNRKKIYTFYQSMNNSLAIYKRALNRGIIKLTDSKKHKVEIRLFDYSGNESKTVFFVYKSSQSIDNKYVNAFFDRKFCLQNDEISLTIPKNSLFFDENIQIKKLKQRYSPWSSTYSVGNDFIPLKNSIILAFNVANCPSQLLSKLYVVKINSRNKRTAITGQLNNTKLVIRTKNFGRYYLALDTIVPQYLKLGKYNQENKIVYQYKIWDTNSGIKNYSVFLNNNWQIAYFDKKRKILNIYLNKKDLHEKNVLFLRLEDYLNNVNEFKELVLY